MTMTGGFRLHGFGFHLTALALLAGLSTAGAGAMAAERTGEARSLTARIEQIERDMRAVQAQTSGAATAQANAAELTARVAALEESLRALTGQVEELNHKLQQLAAQNAGGSGTGTALIMTPEGSNTNSATLTPPPPPASGQGAATAAVPPPAAGTLGTLKAPKTPPPGELPTGDGEVQFKAAYDVLYHGDYPGGAQAFQSFIQQYPKSPKIPDAHYWLGQAQFVQKDYRGAAQTYLTLVKQYPKSNLAPDGMIKLGRSLIELNEKKAGCDTLASVATMKPTPNQSILEAARMQQTKAGCK